MVFLLLGQSNMEGAPVPEAADQVADGRVEVLAYDDAPELGRTYNRWYPASPPLHSATSGLGPGDYFGRTLAEAFPETGIGLVPCGINGVDIDYYRKGVVSNRRREFAIPPDNHWVGAYDWVIERARIAQDTGPIRGILFHQGESDNGKPQWLGKVAEVVADLRTDLGLGDVPFLAGELLYSGRCREHNALVNQLPQRISNAFVVSASGLVGQDEFHFDLAGQRTLGRRYGETMIGALRDLTQLDRAAG
ncbi:MAG: sialate O-acetylesterase [Polyangiaceae bacterium]|nr:sialate O-acetylesterase [Polyangiaceae bacterium]